MASDNLPGAFVYPHPISAVADILAADLAEKSHLVLVDAEAAQPGLPAEVAARVTQAFAMLDQNQRALEAWMAGQSVVTLTGVLDGSGNASANHGVDRMSHKVLLVMGWWHNGGNATLLTCNGVNDTYVSVSAGSGGAGLGFRVAVWFSETETGW